MGSAGWWQSDVNVVDGAHVVRFVATMALHVAHDVPGGSCSSAKP